MELNTPLSELSDPTYNSSQSTQENIQQKRDGYKIDLNSYKKDKITVRFSFFYPPLITTIVVAIGYISFFFEAGILPFLTIFFIIGFVLFLILFIKKYKIEVYKLNNIIYANVKNIFSCNKIQLSGNLHFYYKNVYIDEDSNKNHFFIINDIENKIDLDKSEIKQKPVKLFYHFEDIDKIKADKIINNFEENTNNNDNPILFDIIKYMGKTTNNLINDPHHVINRFLKFGEYFYTLYLDSPLIENSFDSSCCLYVALMYNAPFLFFSVIFLYIKEDKNIFYRFIGVFGLILINIIIFLLCKCCSTCRAHDSRIDFIYSKDFKRLFIGIVNYDEKSYIRTFEYQTEQIDHFYFQKPEFNYNNYYFKVLLKYNNVNEAIYQFKKIDKDDQEGLEYILNGKANNNKDYITPNYN